MLKIKRIAGMAAMSLIALSIFSSCVDSKDPDCNCSAGDYDVDGFYILNQGNMGQNKASLDFLNAEKDELYLNVYDEVNPNKVMGLGDVGNEIAIFDEDELWIIVNGSNKVEVLDAFTCESEGEIEIPSPRYMAKDGDYVYVTSYAGPVDFSDSHAQKGFVAKINVNTLKEEDRCIVGYQPDGIAISGGKIYVANSDGFSQQYVDGEMSVIDIASFKVEKTVTVGMNLNRVFVDPQGKIWITSRGNYYDVNSRIHCYDPAKGEVVANLDVPNSVACINDGILYVIGANWNYETQSNTISYAEIDTRSMTVTTTRWNGASEFDKIVYPYCIAVDPQTGDICITDAGDFISPGWAYLFGADKSYKWSRRTGDIPCSIAFTGK